MGEQLQAPLQRRDPADNSSRSREKDLLLNDVWFVMAAARRVSASFSVPLSTFERFHIALIRDCVEG